jgi:putative transposase
MRNGQKETRQQDLLVLNDELWAKIIPHITGDGHGRGAVGRDNRMFFEGILWIARTGSAWRDLPEEFGAWNSVFRRFRRWGEKGVWHRIFDVLTYETTFEYLIVDDTIIHTRQRAGSAARQRLRIRSSWSRRNLRGQFPSETSSLKH